MIKTEHTVCGQNTIEKHTVCIACFAIQLFDNNLLYLFSKRSLLEYIKTQNIVYKKHPARETYIFIYCVEFMYGKDASAGQKHTHKKKIQNYNKFIQSIYKIMN